MFSVTAVKAAMSCPRFNCWAILTFQMAWLFKLKARFGTWRRWPSTWSRPTGPTTSSPTRTRTQVEMIIGLLENNVVFVKFLEARWLLPHSTNSREEGALGQLTGGENQVLYCYKDLSKQKIQKYWHFAEWWSSNPHKTLTYFTSFSYFYPFQIKMTHIQINMIANKNYRKSLNGEPSPLRGLTSLQWCGRWYIINTIL